MAEAAHELPLVFEGHAARVCARSDADGGWDVRTEVDGRAIATDYCPDWRSVERFHTRMQQWLKAASATAARLSHAA